MKKILIIGSGSLESDFGKKLNAFKLRTIQYRDALERGLADCEIRLITLTKQKNEAGSDCLYIKDKRAIQKIVDEYKPYVILGVNIEGSIAACSVSSAAKIICDLNGWTMAEAQAQAKTIDSDDLLSHLWSKERECLEKGDFFVAVSEAQLHAIYGGLASVGRLNKDSFGVRMVRLVRNSREVRMQSAECRVQNAECRMQSAECRMQSAEFSGEVVTVSWVGGYNNWADVETLFLALEYAMSRDKRIRFISTGGKIERLDDNTFGKFRKLVEKSQYNERFEFLGWVDGDEIPGIYAKSDIGINTDFDCAETWFGARNRLNEMMMYGLPIVSTAGSEISEIVRSSNAGIVCKNGDFESVGKAILALAENQEMRSEMGANGEKYTQKNTPEYACREVIELIRNMEKYEYKRNKVQMSGIVAKIKAVWRYIKIR